MIREEKYIVMEFMLENILLQSIFMVSFKNPKKKDPPKGVSKYMIQFTTVEESYHTHGTLRILYKEQNK